MPAGESGFSGEAGISRIISVVSGGRTVFVGDSRSALGVARARAGEMDFFGEATDRFSKEAAAGDFGLDGTTTGFSGEGAGAGLSDSV